MTARYHYIRDAIRAMPMTAMVTAYIALLLLAAIMVMPW